MSALPGLPPSRQVNERGGSGRLRQSLLGLPSLTVFIMPQEAQNR